MIIPLRIKTIANFIDHGEKVADVGADHGLLEIYLLAKFTDVRVIAIENKKGPYENLKNNLIAFKNIRLSYSDGLTAMDRETTTIVLAGMGGLNIKKILDVYPLKTKKAKKIIIDAHRDGDIARETIINYSFRIKCEKIVYEQGKYYVISVFEKADKIPEYSKDELCFGYKLYEDELWPSYKEYLIKQNKKTIQKIGDNEKLQNKVEYLKSLNERIENYGKN